MKTKFFILSFFYFLYSYSQTGIGIPNPKSALHIKAVNSQYSALKITNSSNDLDIFDITNVGDVTLPNLKDAFFLSTNVDGKVISKNVTDVPGIPILVGFFERTNSTSLVAKSYFDVPFGGVFKIKPTHVKYDFNGINFTILTAGYYQINGYVQYDLSIDKDKSGTVVSQLVFKSGNTPIILTSATTTYIANSTFAAAGHNLITTKYLNVNDVVTLKTYYDNKYSIGTASLVFTYFGV